jgi:uncharacterized protein (DUF111 family)
VYLTQCIGRKGRPSIEATVLCSVETAPLVRTVLYTRTPTLGIRMRVVERDFLAREIREVQTRFGVVRVKVAFLDGKPLRAVPEFSDCASAAGAAGLPVSAVLAEIGDQVRVLLEAPES